MKKIAFLVVLIISLVVLAAPGTVQAASGPAVSSSTVTLNFPASITFNVSASSDVNIVDIRLHYAVDRLSFAKVVAESYLDFTPSSHVATQWVWDMRKTGGLPPGATVDYWWTVTDAAGKSVATAPATFEIKDARYSWHSLVQGKVTLYWYKGDNAFAGELMASVQDALKRLAGNTGVEISKPVQFYIYASAADLQGSMIFPQDWTGGVAFTEYGIIAIGIGTSAAEISWGKGTVAHELTHLVVHQLTYNPYNDLPTWLDEGLAMFNEGPLDSQFTTPLNQAITRKSLNSVRTISSPFSAYGGESVLDYAESYSIVKYLIDTYGQPKMFALLSTFQKGSSYDGALQSVYGFDMDGLNVKWQASLGITVMPPATTQPSQTTAPAQPTTVTTATTQQTKEPAQTTATAPPTQPPAQTTAPAAGKGLSTAVILRIVLIVVVLIIVLALFLRSRARRRA